MKARLILAALACGALLVPGLRADEEEEREFAATCPVSGQPASEDSSVEYLGKSLYFCCDNCPAAYEAEPEKFTARANFQLLQTGQIVAFACPLTGRALNAETAEEVGGVSVTFCCNGCRGRFSRAADDAAKIELVFADLSKGFTLQTECPVSGRPIDVTASVEHEGQKVFFCCPNCPAAFTADPDKYLSKLPQFAESE